MKYVIALLSLIIFASCSTYSEEELNAFDNEIQAYIKKKGIECERSGIRCLLQNN